MAVDTVEEQPELMPLPIRPPPDSPVSSLYPPHTQLSGFTSIAFSDLPAQDPLREPLQEPLQDPLQEPSREPLQDPLQETSREPSREPLQDPLQETSREPLQESSQDPLQESSQDPLQKPSQDHSQDPLQDPSQDLEQAQAQAPLDLLAPPLPQTDLYPITTPNLNYNNVTMGHGVADFINSISNSSSPLSSPASVNSKSTTDPAVSKGNKAVSTMSADTTAGKLPATSNISKKRSCDDDDDDDDDRQHLHVTPPKKSVKLTPAKPKVVKPAAPPTVTRPSRTRKAPERFVDLDLEEEAKKKKKKPVPRKGVSRVFDPEYATTNSQSRLGKADVYHMLLEPTAWTSLTVSQRASLIKHLPPTAANALLLAAAAATDPPATELARPKELQINFDIFRTDVAKFKDDLTAGHLAKTWLLSAAQAVRDRAEGRFDSWKAEEAERWWGQKSNML
ncbi:hypothetical protein K504DRAFT_466008 [Pleomassaria siparia CBS 279.74]|uniref:ASX DEUBAD domain-containing protein n=1 Tax=Pleomassaria siparia CBS 279.74 TaxID=1314801 RepID=A0A6G1KDT3_9PLEO|nr:hypothetical protein K504DRAFT_466008 [Pleomassaria siparia CBS 279.74]